MPLANFRIYWKFISKNKDNLLEIVRKCGINYKYTEKDASSLHIRPRSGRAWTVRTPKNIEAVAENSSTVNGEAYRPMITDFSFVPALYGIDVNDVWSNFEVGETTHIYHATITFLLQIFDCRLISRNCNVNWTQRRCHLQPLDCFLCGAVKVKLLYSETIQHLHSNIRDAIAEIRTYISTIE